MAKFLTHHLMSKVQPDVINLIHDEVISLCQKKYGTVSGLEVDGIICISLLDTKEQQVVKIHKTLKSVVPHRNAYPNIANMLSAPASVLQKRFEKRIEGKSLDDQDVNYGKSNSESVEPDFQNDINRLSDLLRDNAQRLSQSFADPHAKQEAKKSKRKTNHPKHVVHEHVQEKADSPSNSKEEKGAATAEGMLMVKEEPQDPDYDIAEQTQPKIVSVESMQGQETVDQDKESSKASLYMSSLLERVIDKEIFSKESSKQSSDSDGHSSSGAVSKSPETVVVKTEPVTDDSEYGVQNLEMDSEERGKDSIDNANNEEESEIPREWLYQGMSEGDKTDGRKELQEKHWLYGIAKSMHGGATAEVGQNEAVKQALASHYQTKGSFNANSVPSLRPKEVKLSGRSWIEMVKENVNKYQAALIRTANKTKQASDSIAARLGEPPVASCVPKATVENVNALKALLQGPALKDASQIIVRPLASNSYTTDDISRESRSRSEPLQNSSPDRSQSASPVVKIEVDDTSDAYSPQPPSGSDTAGPAPGMDRPQGKLESRYPALFNQLQQAKKTKDNGLDQGDSLVNRLPFISFQELFSQPPPKTSEEITKQLLAQAKLDPRPLRASGKKKTIWKWKKRQVRPKDENGELITYFPKVGQETATSDGETGAYGTLSAKKSTPRKRPKSDNEGDKTYTPYKSRKVIEKMHSELTDEGISSSVRTRLSSGDKAKINFAELDDSELDMEVMEDYPEAGTSNSSSIELVSAFCKNKCGQKFSSFEDLQEHEQICDSGARDAGAGGAEDLGRVMGGKGDFKCTMCGLEFNQQYRWHYHMIKVHHVSEEKTQLFR